MVYQVCLNDEPRIIFDLLMAWLNLCPSCCGNTGRILQGICRYAMAVYSDGALVEFSALDQRLCNGHNFRTVWNIVIKLHRWIYHQDDESAQWDDVPLSRKTTFVLFILELYAIATIFGQGLWPLCGNFLLFLWLCGSFIWIKHCFSVSFEKWNEFWRRVILFGSWLVNDYSCLLTTTN